MIFKEMDGLFERSIVKARCKGIAEVRPPFFAVFTMDVLWRFKANPPLLRASALRAVGPWHGLYG